MKRLFQWLGDSIVSAIGYIGEQLQKLLGEGFRMALSLSILVGIGAFVAFEVLVRYTTPYLDASQAAQIWRGFIGSNGEFLSWLFWDVLAFDYGFHLMLSMLGFWVGIYALGFLISAVKAVWPF